MVVALGQPPPQFFDVRLEDVQLDMSAGGSADFQELVSFATRPCPELDDHPPAEGHQLNGECDHPLFEAVAERFVARVSLRGD